MKRYRVYLSYIISSLMFFQLCNAQSKIIFNIQLSKEGLDYYVSRGAKENRDLEAILDYLKEEYNAPVATTAETREVLFSASNSICNIVNVGWEIGSFKSNIGAVGKYPMKIRFFYCDQSFLEYEFPVNVNGYTYDLKMAILRALKKNIPQYEVLKKLKEINVNKDISVLKRDALDSLKKQLPIDSLEIAGVYKLISSSTFSSLSQIGIFKINDNLNIINIENSAYKDDWKIGQVIGTIHRTASSKYFIGTYKGIVGGELEISILSDSNIIELTYTKSKESRKFIKVL